MWPGNEARHYLVHVTKVAVPGRNKHYVISGNLIGSLHLKHIISELPLRGGARVHCVNAATIDATMQHQAGMSPALNGSSEILHF